MGVGNVDVREVPNSDCRLVVTPMAPTNVSYNLRIMIPKIENGP